MADLQLGKYELYPYTDEEGHKLPTVEELLEFLKTPGQGQERKGR